MVIWQELSRLPQKAPAPAKGLERTRTHARMHAHKWTVLGRDSGWSPLPLATVLHAGVETPETTKLE